jgi:hypothetical protein
MNYFILFFPAGGRRRHQKGGDGGRVGTPGTQLAVKAQTRGISVQKELFDDPSL